MWFIKVNRHASDYSGLQELNEIVVWGLLRKEKKKSHTTGVFLLLHFKLYPSVKFSGYETVGNYHHDTWDEEQNEEQQDVPNREKESKIFVNEKAVNQYS